MAILVPLFIICFLFVVSGVSGEAFVYFDHRDGSHMCVTSSSHVDGAIVLILPCKADALTVLQDWAYSSSSGYIHLRSYPNMVLGVNTDVEIRQSLNVDTPIVLRDSTVSPFTCHQWAAGMRTDAGYEFTNRRFWNKNLIGLPDSASGDILWAHSSIPFNNRGQFEFITGRLVEDATQIEAEISEKPSRVPILPRAFPQISKSGHAPRIEPARVIHFTASGIVVDSFNTPLRDVLVSSAVDSTFTNNNGFFEVSVLETSIVTVSAPDHYSINITVDKNSRDAGKIVLSSMLPIDSIRIVMTYQTLAADSADNSFYAALVDRQSGNYTDKTILQNTCGRSTSIFAGSGQMSSVTIRYLSKCPIGYSFYVALPRKPSNSELNVWIYGFDGLKKRFTREVIVSSAEINQAWRVVDVESDGDIAMVDLFGRLPL